MHSVCKRLGDLLAVLILLPLLLMVGQPATANTGEGEALRSKNKLQAVSLEGGATPSVLIQTEQPVGYRYTIYDSFDPLRIVIDFPGLDASAV
jgi:type IV pilus assembly protein PilQ